MGAVDKEIAMSKMMRSAAMALAALAFLMAGFEMGARSVKFSPASQVEMSGIIIGGPAVKSARSM